MGRQEPEGSALLGRILGRVRLATRDGLVLDTDEGPIVLRLTARTRLVAHTDSPLRPGTLVEVAYARIGRVRTAAMVVRLGAPPPARSRAHVQRQSEGPPLHTRKERVGTEEATAANEGGTRLEPPPRVVCLERRDRSALKEPAPPS